MVVKEKRGRRRYIAFDTSTPASNETLLAYLTAVFAPIGVKTPKVIQFDGKRGIVRCSPTDKDKVLIALSSKTILGISISTLSTSGTLRTLREKYFPTEEHR
jgi:RNase P/RNase MRP subunit POP5